VANQAPSSCKSIESDSRILICWLWLYLVLVGGEGPAEGASPGLEVLEGTGSGAIHPRPSCRHSS
jgi:hypothetical protein